MPADRTEALALVVQLRQDLDWLAREIDLNGNISPDLTARIKTGAGELARMAAAQGS